MLTAYEVEPSKFLSLVPDTGCNNSETISSTILIIKMRCFSTFLRHVYTMKRTKEVFCNPNKNCSLISGKTDDPPLEEMQV